MYDLIASNTQCNNCFVLGGKEGSLSRFYELSYEQACRTLNTYLNGKRANGDNGSLRVSLYLDNAMCGNLHICHTGAVTLDGANKVDLFSDARRFIYEWEEWDNTVGLTDRTQGLFELLQDNFTFKRSMEAGQHGTRRRAADSGAVVLDEKDELELLPRMNDAQKGIFDDLKTISSDCTHTRGVVQYRP